MNFRATTKEEYQNFYDKSIQESDAYWEERAKTYRFKTPWKNVRSGDFNNLDMKWFDGATLNITENALDRHVETHPDKIAIHWEPNDPKDKALTFTYKEVLQEVNKISNMLTKNGVKKGDRICFYMSMVPELLFGVLASARVGAIHSVVFGGFSAQALSGRVEDCQARFIFANDEAYRGDKIIPLKKITDEALENNTCVEKVFVTKRTGGNINMKAGRDVWLHEETASMSDQFEAVEMQAEDPLFILYTSGSTGKPKGLQHTTAGYMLWASETYKNVFQVETDDIFWCTADIGWITGHSYITYGPMLNGSTQVIFEGVPTFPNPARFWDICDKYQVTHFYTAPTAIRALEACDSKYIDNAKLDSLKVLGTVGEPINEEAWSWYNKKVGKEKCPIVDTWWQTETGGIMISNLAGVTPSIPTMATTPLPGVDPILVDSEGKIIEGSPAEGNLCIRQPWPGMARTIYGDHDRYHQTYFSTYPGYYFTGDGAKRDAKGNYRITGRVDDVINVSGHRIGTAEVEDAIDENSHVIEAAVVGFPHEIKGQGIMAYIISAGEVTDKDTLHKELNKTITEIIGPIAKLDKILVVSELPKTRSGKIMRRILRKVAANEIDGLGDTSTLLNPEIVDEIILKAKDL